MNINSIDVAMKVAFGYPVMILGENDILNRTIMAEALFLLEGEDYYRKNFRIDMHEANRYTVRMPYNARFDEWKYSDHDEFAARKENQMNDYPNHILCFINVWSASSYWIMQMLLRLHQGRRMIMLGKDTPFSCLSDRCYIVRP